MKKQILAIGGGGFTMKPGIACDDAVAAHYIDGKLRYFVSSLPNAKAYKIKAVNGNINELIIDPTYLKDL